jgi:hypothetical protein
METEVMNDCGHCLIISTQLVLIESCLLDPLLVITLFKS